MSTALPVLVVVLVGSMLLAVSIGSVHLPFGVVWRVVGHHLAPGFVSRRGISPAQDQIVWGLRVPRVLLGAVVGAGLSSVGAVLQALVRNPLADPYVFGISSGAAVGATAVIVLGVTIGGTYSVSFAAFVGALGAFACVMSLAGRTAGLSPGRLLLAGVAVAQAMSALTSSILYFGAGRQSDAGKAQQVMFWLLGGLASATWTKLYLPGLVVIAGTFVLVTNGRTLNTVLVGEESSATLGVDLQRLRWQLFALTALMTGVIVAVSGGIGFVGLIVPHMVRLAVGSDHRRLLPVTVLVGAIFMVWADVVARVAASPQEIPIGVVTALIGTPLFAAMLRSRRFSIAMRA